MASLFYEPLARLELATYALRKIVGYLRNPLVYNWRYLFHKITIFFNPH